MYIIIYLTVFFKLIFCFEYTGSILDQKWMFCAPKVCVISPHIPTGKQMLNFLINPLMPIFIDYLYYTLIR